MGEMPLLGEYLSRLDWSPERLAREINRVCGPGTISAKAPYGWLRGSCPRGRLPQVVATILTRRLNEPITAEELWPKKFSSRTVILAADDGLDLPWTQEGTLRSAAMLIPPTESRSQPVTLLGLNGSDLIRPAIDWLTALDVPTAGSMRGAQLNPDAVRVLAERVGQLRRLDDTQGGPLVLEWVVQDLRWAANLVRSASYDASTGTLLFRALAELAQLAGWVACDLGHEALGQRYFLVGLRASHAAGDRQLGANIVSCLSYQASWSGNREDALRLIKLARKGAGHPPSASVRALLATRQARAHAQLGQHDQCEQVLDEAAGLGEAITTDSEPPWAYWVTPAVLAADAGRAWLELGQAERAEEDLLRGLRLFGAAQPRNRLLHNTSLAEARLARRDVDGAAEATHDALDLTASFGSARARSRLRDLRAKFTPIAAAAAREICDRIETVLSA
ncbi:hypothetical protein [Streptomyces sp. GC420]|uniref:hypothetical protein n=1 Tax=Streptomyces sp. GC420 TaxID=2697568 RepID=UPI00141526B9|nr:hypothetical protein [Streptomyces sp. GC420]NBM14459.1 hypothetical protein [Streptomyces sp. GC420]